MPVILPPEAKGLWLAQNTPKDQLIALLRPANEDVLGAYRVSSRVNKPQNDDAECIEAIK